MKEIIWKQNGWTALQDADVKKHILGIMIYAEDGIVKEVRRRHNDGEEEVLKGALQGNYSLPMPIEEFKEAYTKGLIALK